MKEIKKEFDKRFKPIGTNNYGITEMQWRIVARDKNDFWKFLEWLLKYIKKQK